MLFHGTWLAGSAQTDILWRVSSSKIRVSVEGFVIGRGVSKVSSVHVCASFAAIRFLGYNLDEVAVGCAAFGVGCCVRFFD